MNSELPDQYKLIELYTNKKETYSGRVKSLAVNCKESFEKKNLLRDQLRVLLELDNTAEISIIFHQAYFTEIEVVGFSVNSFNEVSILNKTGWRTENIEKNTLGHYSKSLLDFTIRLHINAHGSWFSATSHEYDFTLQSIVSK